MDDRMQGCMDDIETCTRFRSCFQGAVIADSLFAVQKSTCLPRNRDALPGTPLWLYCFYATAGLSSGCSAKGLRKQRRQRSYKVPQTLWSSALEHAPGPKVGVKETGPTGPTVCAEQTQGRQTQVGRVGT